ncbi:MAG: alpha/beta fold hydrolase [Pseudomonadota bacterium]|nr:alpha/beta fold hydrolase [Pseudomonadota bacterium]
MLYPIKKSFATYEVKRGKHTVYFEDYGNKQGKPVIFLHGGPGSGCSDWQKSLFNNKVFRVIFLDQRGSGRSFPKRLLEKNTTYELVDDIEFIRTFLKINEFCLVGGSWGSTLAIAYSEKYPDNIKGMVLRALFLGTKKEIDWAFKKAPMIFKPTLIAELNRFLNNKIFDNPIIKLGKMLESKKLEDKCIAAELWQEYEKNLSSINATDHDFKSILKNNIGHEERYRKVPNTPFLENHYIKNNFFLKDNQLLNNKNVLKNIKISIIQGQYDFLCPPINSFLFSSGLPKAEVIKVNKAGHYVSDPEVKEIMRKKIDDLQYL